MLLMHYCLVLAVRDDMTAPVFEMLQLERPVTEPPLASIRSVASSSLPSFIESQFSSKAEYDAWKSFKEARVVPNDGCESGVLEGHMLCAGLTKRRLGSSLRETRGPVAVPLGGGFCEEDADEIEPND